MTTAGVQLLHSLIYLYHSDKNPARCWGSTLTLPDILGIIQTLVTMVAGVQLLHSLIYLILITKGDMRSWGSTLTLPDILVAHDAAT